MNQSEKNPASLYKTIEKHKSEATIRFYIRTQDVDLKTAEEHYDELKKMLCLFACYPGTITPSEQLDEMWHAALIQTIEYTELCNKLGVFINHTTMSNPQVDKYDNMLSVYQLSFGTPHDVWTMSKKIPYPGDDCKECVAAAWCGEGEGNG